MTMSELQVEFDVCGSEMLLTVSRMDIKETHANHQLETLQDLAMDWNDIGACAPLKRKRVSFEDDVLNVQYVLPMNDNVEVQVHNSAGELGGIEVDSWQNSAHPPNDTISQRRIDHQPQVAMDDTALSLETSEQLKSNEQLISNPIHKESTRGIVQFGSNTPLSMADDLGCKKCRRELRTGIKSTNGHDENCPRVSKPRAKKTSGEKARHSNDAGRKTDTATSSQPQKQIIRSEGSSQKYIQTQKCIQKEKHDASHCEEIASDKEGEFSAEQSATNQPSRDDGVDGGDSFSSSTDCDGGDDEDGDENPWLGCVCGMTHPHPIKVFWIQCEGCEAWYNAAEECLGFDANAAKELTDWCCWACHPPVAGMGL